MDGDLRLCVGDRHGKDYRWPFCVRIGDVAFPDEHYTGNAYAILFTWSRELADYFHDHEPYVLLPFLFDGLQLRIQGSNPSHNILFVEGYNFEDDPLHPDNVVLEVLVDPRVFARQVLTLATQLAAEAGDIHPYAAHTLADLRSALDGTPRPAPWRTPMPKRAVRPPDAKQVPLALTVDGASITPPQHPGYDARLNLTLSLVMPHFDAVYSGPVRTTRGDGVFVLLQWVSELAHYWGDMHEEGASLSFPGLGADLALERDPATQHDMLVAQTNVLPSEVPMGWSLLEQDADYLSDDEYDPTTTMIEVVLEVGPLDGVSFTRQIMDAARTLIALMGARGLTSRNTRRIARQLDDLECLLLPLLDDDGGTPLHGQ